MKYSFTIAFLFFYVVFLSEGHGQVHTGGVAAPIENTLFGGISTLSKLNVHLIRKDVMCSKNKTLFQGSDPNLMAVYLKLSLLKSSENPIDGCDDVKKYFQCLNDEETKHLSSQILFQTKTIKQLQLIYKIDEKEAQEMVKFFNSLE